MVGQRPSRQKNWPTSGYGRTCPYRRRLDRRVSALPDAIKAVLDPHRLMNLGTLGLARGEG